MVVEMARKFRPHRDMMIDPKAKINRSEHHQSHAAHPRRKIVT